MNAINRKTTLSAADRSAINALHFEDIIDAARFGSREDRVLALYGEDVETLFPKTNVLARLGLDIAALSMLVQYDCIDGAEIGQIVRDITAQRTTVELVNASLRDRRPIVDGRGRVFKHADLSGLGLDMDAIRGCRGRTMDEDQLSDLVRHFARGWTKPEQANTGLFWKASEARAAA